MNSSRWIQNDRIPNLDFDMIYYADDMMIFLRDNRALNELSKLTKIISGKYNFRLNQNKYLIIQINYDDVIHFENGESLPKKSK